MATSKVFDSSKFVTYFIPATVISALAISIAFLVRTWPQEPLFFQALEQRTWYPEARMIERKSQWVRTHSGVITKYKEECPQSPDPMAIGKWTTLFPAEEAFCRCVGNFICENNIQATANVTSDDHRMKLVECQLRDRIQKKQCGLDADCIINTLNLGYLMYVWNYFSLMLSVYVLIGWSNDVLGWQGRTMGMVLGLAMIAGGIIFFVPLMKQGDRGNTEVLVVMGVVYILVGIIPMTVNRFLKAGQNKVSLTEETTLESFMLLMTCNATYFFTVPLGILIMYAATFELDGPEIFSVTMTSILIPALQLLISIPTTLGKEARYADNAILVTCSAIVALSVTMPHVRHFLDMEACDASRPQYWKNVSGLSIFFTVLINSLYPAWEMIFKKAGIMRAGEQSHVKDYEAWYLTAFFILMDAISRGTLMFQSQQLPCVLNLNGC